MGVGISLDGLAGGGSRLRRHGALPPPLRVWLEGGSLTSVPLRPTSGRWTGRCRHAKVLAHGTGLIAVNAMVATTQYADSVRTALRAGADAIVCGAGLPKDLPALASEVSDSDAAIAPIVRSGRAAGAAVSCGTGTMAASPTF